VCGAVDTSVVPVGVRHLYDQLGAIGPVTQLVRVEGADLGTVWQAERTMSDTGVLAGPDGVTRCPWAATDPLLQRYHDTEWGVAIHDESALYERIVLEGFQAGLSWRLILDKRPAFRKAFADFTPDVVAGFTDDQLEALRNDRSIVRSRVKIEAARANARAVVALRDEDGLDHLIWSHQPPTGPAPRTIDDIPARTDDSATLADALRGHGFKFVGPTTAYALMEAIGMVNPHLADCFRRDAPEIIGS
jgi:DNA-3-methyladenine glycosylase I